MKKKKQFGRSFRTYLLTYLVVLLVPLLFMLYGYTYSSRTIEQESQEYHRNLLRQTRQVYDQIFIRVSSEMQLLSTDQQVNSLMRVREWKSEDLFDVVELKATLGNIKFINPHCDNIGVYFHQADSLVTNYRRYPDQLMFLYTDGLMVTEEEFFEGINLAQLEGYFLIGDTPENLRMIFYHNVYGVSFRDVYATVLVSIPWSAMKEMSASIGLSEYGGTFLINSDNHVIGNSNPSVDISQIHFDSLEDSQMLITENGQKMEYMVSYLSSQKTDIKYVMYTPKSVFFEKVNYLYYSIIIELVLCLIVGICLAVFFARRTFNPIREMLSLLEGQKKEKGQVTDMVTYEKLQGALRGLLDEKVSMEKRLEQSDQTLQRGVLLASMKGWQQYSGQAEVYFQQMQEEWESQDYRIILFKLDHLEKCKLFEGQSEEEQFKTWPLVMFTIQNVLEELLLEEEAGTIIEIENMMACIINISSDWSDAELELRIRKCVDFYKEAFELITYVAVSGIHQGAYEISLAYEEAYEIIAHKQFWGNEVADILLYDNEMMAEESGEQLQIMEMDKKMLNHLTAREYAKAEEILEEILEQELKRDIRYLSYNQCRASGIVSVLLGLVEDLFGEKENDFYQNMRVSERLLKADSLAKLKEEIHAIFAEITDYYENSSRKDEPAWIEEIEKYLQENYQDPNINISAIAETFNMSLSYMGRTFKRYRGESMLDHIHVLRLKGCKELLEQGWTVKDAAEKNGYIDSKAMIRAFKRYEGITPGQYKKQG